MKRVGALLLAKVRDGDVVEIEDDRVYVGTRLIGVGVRQTVEGVLASMDEARTAMAERFESFARNTVDYMQRERDLLFGGSGLPALDHDLAGRPVLVVVRGTNYKEDLAVLGAYIRDVRPVLLGVDGGADALIEAGYDPDLILGDMDSVSDETLALAAPPPRRWWRRRPRPAELVLHAYRDGHAPGRERLETLGVPFRVVEAAGTSEDVALLLAHEKGAETIVTVGSHGNLREFLDKGRQGMASTFLVRLRVGEILVDAKGVSRLYNPGVTRGQLGLFLLAFLGVPLAVVGLTFALMTFFSHWSLPKALIVAFILFNVAIAGGVGIWAYMSFEVVAGLFWFLAKTFTLVFVFAWLRATLPRVRIDQLMGWAWKWLVEIALLNIFITAGAILLIQELSRR